MSDQQISLLEAIEARIDSEGFDSLTSYERQAFAVSWLFIEAFKGGLHQFFFNEAGRLADDAVRGLEMVGADRHADILQRAIALFPDGRIPHDLVKRRGLLTSLPDEIQWDRMDTLTKEFFQMAADHDVDALLRDYVFGHMNLFPSYHRNSSQSR